MDLVLEIFEVKPETQNQIDFVAVCWIFVQAFSVRANSMLEEIVVSGSARR